MLVLPAQKYQGYSLHFLPAHPQALAFSPPPSHTSSGASSPITYPSSMSSSKQRRGQCSRESSYDSQSSVSSTRTIHDRRTMSRTRSSQQGPAPPPLSGFAELFRERVGGYVAVPERSETDEECWERMLALQREYHCYKSARLEAAVEAIEGGCPVDMVPMPSRLCLDLLNEELKCQIEARREGYI